MSTPLICPKCHDDRQIDLECTSPNGTKLIFCSTCGQRSTLPPEPVQ